MFRQINCQCTRICFLLSPSESPTHSYALLDRLVGDTDCLIRHLAVPNRRTRYHFRSEAGRGGRGLCPLVFADKLCIPPDRSPPFRRALQITHNLRTGSLPRSLPKTLRFF